MASRQKIQKSILTSLASLGAAALATLILWYAVSLFEKAPRADFHLLDGRKVSTRSFEGQPLLVIFWSTTCEVCIKEIPDLIRMYRSLHPKGLELVAVSMAHDAPDVVQRFSQRMRIPYLMAVDVDSKVKRAFARVLGTPTAFLINKHGYIVEYQTGALDLKAIEQKIIKLLPKEKAA